MGYNIIEQWKDIEGYNGRYKISNLGNVKSNCYGEDKILKFRKRQHGYLCVALYDHNKCKNISVHRLVAQHFCSQNENKNEVNHKNGDKTDNCYINLEWVNRKENMKHSSENNLSAKGEKSKLSQLKEKDIIDIRNLVFNFSISEIARQHNVCFKTIKKILLGQRWKHVPYANKEEVIFYLKNSELHKRRGEFCSKTKLTIESVNLIKNMASNNNSMTQKEIANKFGVSKSAVQSILCGKTWSWI